MIIEFFGPPAVGKSTLAHALASELRGKGKQVLLYTSDRPAEKLPTNNVYATSVKTGISVLTAPLQRAGKLAGVVQSIFSSRPRDDVGTSLLTALPPQNWLSRVRLHRYLYTLKQLFEEGRGYQGITIIDQGYLTALSSLAVRTPALNSLKLARAFALLPCPDLVISLDAQDYVLQARIASRHARQTATERLFEQDVRRTRRQVEMVRTVAAMLKANSWPAVYCISTDDNIVEKIVEEIAQKNATQCQAA